MTKIKFVHRKKLVGKNKNKAAKVNVRTSGVPMLASMVRALDMFISMPSYQNKNISHIGWDLRLTLPNYYSTPFVYFNLLSVQGNTSDTLACKWPSLDIIAEEHYPAGYNSSGPAFGDISLSDMKSFIQFARSHATADLSYGTVTSSQVTAEGITMLSCVVIVGPVTVNATAQEAQDAGQNRSVVGISNTTTGLTDFFCIEETNYSLATHIHMYIGPNSEALLLTK